MLNIVVKYEEPRFSNLAPILLLSPHPRPWGLREGSEAQLLLDRRHTLPARPDGGKLEEAQARKCR